MLLLCLLATLAAGPLVSADLTADVAKLKETIEKLAYQVQMHQFASEERVRAEGDSGVSQNRVLETGTKNYHSASHTHSRMMSIHEHGNFINTLGLGELVAVLNGVHFMTRHNDYRAATNSRSNFSFFALDDIEFPELPDQLKTKPKTDAEMAKQITWLRQCFKDWGESKMYSKHCDVKKLFKPIMCYLEGVWLAKTDSYFEPFPSDRHHIDAKSYKDLHQKIMFASSTGRKDALENFSFLPTKIVNVTSDDITIAQWTYRIICHPIDQNKVKMPRSKFRLLDDLSTRASRMRSFSKMDNDRASRFQMMPNCSSWISKRSNYEKDFRMFGATDGAEKETDLDKIMRQIPGVSHDPATWKNIRDDAYGEHVYRMDAKDNTGSSIPDPTYSRYYKEFTAGANGRKLRKRTFSDSCLFMALNNRPEVAPTSMYLCRDRACKWYTQRWSYAIPLEVIYLTPLNSWNPYGLVYRGKSNTAEGMKVTSNGRNGGFTKSTAFDGLNNKNYYITPAEFFTMRANATVSTDTADTIGGTKGVLTADGQSVKNVVASGIRILLPEIAGAGELRARFPIACVHGEGSGVWKEVNAIKDVVTKWQQYKKLFIDDPPAMP